MPRILIVDDSITVRRTVAVMLRADGHDLQFAEDGISALEMLGRTSFDLVIADMEMPHLGGLSLCAVTKCSNASANPPVLIATSHDADIDLANAKRAGAFGLLPKPFNVDALRKAIASALSGS